MAQETLEDERCSVCGEDKIISLPDAIFAFPGQPIVTCLQLQDAGYTGVVPIEYCSYLPALIGDICACTSNATMSPTAPIAPSEPTTAPTPLPTPVSCSICGNSDQSWVVTNPEAIFGTPTQPNISCGMLEQAGRSGLLSFEYCRALPEQVSTICGCSNTTINATSPQWNVPTQGPLLLDPEYDYYPSKKAAPPADPTFGSNDGTIATTVIISLVITFFIIGVVIACYYHHSKHRKKDAILTTDDEV